jgi:phosphonate transport system substrate-binding protein
MVRGDTDAMATNVRSWIKNDRSKEPTGNGDYKVLLRSGDLPMDMIMAGGHIKGQEYDTIKNAIVENETMLLEALFRGVDANDGSSAHSKYKGTRLVPVVDSDYDVVREMYVAVGMPEFTLD